MALAELLNNGQLWRGSESRQTLDIETDSSGYNRLDHWLPGGGWARGQLIELLYPAPGVGELRLLWPLLKRAKKDSTSPVMWIDPPADPNPVALQQAGISLAQQWVVHSGKDRAKALWSMEQALSSGSCALVLGWLDGRLPTVAQRRLQVAAQNGNTSGWLMRPDREHLQPSAAAYRVRLQAEGGCTRNMLEQRLISHRKVQLELQKRRGGWPMDPQPITLCGLF